MSEFWYSIDYVGFDRIFLTGNDPNKGEFEIELDEYKRNKIIDFNEQQGKAQQLFLMELVNEG